MRLVPQAPRLLTYRRLFCCTANLVLRSSSISTLMAIIPRKLHGISPPCRTPVVFRTSIRHPLGTTGIFSDTEKTWVQRVWAPIAEDFLPFDVDVTTDPAVEPFLGGNGIRGDRREQ